VLRKSKKLQTRAGEAPTIPAKHFRSSFVAHHSCFRLPPRLPTRVGAAGKKAWGRRIDIIPLC
ncbi:MAG: hypothetical protein ACYS9C_11525, partial [Planctomycetota bacterium]